MAESEKVLRLSDFTDYHNNKLKPKITGMESDISDLDTTVGQHTTKLGQHDTAIQANTDAITKLNGADTVDGSVDKKIKDAINTFASQLTNDGIVNTYAEALNYIQSHGAEYTALLGQVTNNATDIETLQSAVSQLRTDLGTLNTTVQSHTQSISSLQGQVDTLSGAMPTYSTAADIAALDWE